MKRSKQIQAVLAAVLATLATATAVRAASVSWSVPSTITGDTDVSTTGTFISAYHLGSVVSAAVNGVTFKPFNGSYLTGGSVSLDNVTLTVPGAQSAHGASWHGQTADSANMASNQPVTGTFTQAYKDTLNGMLGAWGASDPFTLTLSGLTAGNTYSFQSWTMDDRPGTSLRATLLTAGNSVVVYHNIAGGGGTGQYAIGTFVADAATQDFTYLGNGGSADAGQLNAFQLRQLAGVTPPSVWSSANAGDWNLAANWTGGIPNAVGAEADLMGALTANHSVFADSPVVVGTLRFNNANTYVVGGASTLTISAAAGNTGLIDVQAGTQKISLPLIIASNTTLQVADTATLKISNPMEVMPNVAVTTSVTGTGKVVYESNVTLDAGASLSLGSPTAIPALSLATGSSLNVNSSPLVVHNASLSGLTAAANDGRLNSAAVTGDTTGRLTVAVADAVAVGVGSTFAGAKVAAGDVLVKATYFGDSNLDGKVDGSDYTRIDAGYSSAGAKTGWAYGDFNRDGLINGSDYSLIDGSFGAALATLPASAIATPASSIAGPVSVPEPTTIGLLAFGAMGLLGRRSRKN